MNVQEKEKVPKEDGAKETLKGTKEAQGLNFDDLKFIRITEPGSIQIIPRYLIEQVKDNDWIIDNFYKYGAAFITSPLSRFWLLSDSGNVIKGILWVIIDPLREMINCLILSVDKEYQNGQAIKQTVKFLRDFRDELKQEHGIELNDKIMTGTKRPKAFLRAGFKETEYVNLEI